MCWEMRLKERFGNNNKNYNKENKNITSLSIITVLIAKSLLQWQRSVSN